MGLTKRLLEEEFLRWLTERGSQLPQHAANGGKNRPVLRHADGSNITEGEAIGLGAFGIVVHTSQLRINTAAIEEGLQRRCHDLGLGCRLHRVRGAGADGLDHDETVKVNGVDVLNPEYLSKVFITLLPVTATQRGADGEITAIDVGGERLTVVI